MSEEDEVELGPEELRDLLWAYRKLVELPAWEDLRTRAAEAVEVNRNLAEGREIGLDSLVKDAYDKGVREGIRYLVALPENIIEELTMYLEVDDGDVGRED